MQVAVGALYQRPTTFIGFDSAWADNPKAPGAICAIVFDGQDFSDFTPPELVGFDGARSFIERHHREDRLTLIAIDQPTVVANAGGMRPVERLAATFISWLGGGVQPANTSKLGMFCPAAPIWPFMKAIGAVQDPIASRTATSGTHIVEVFPALALPSLEPSFFGLKKGPRYNPRVRTFKADDFHAVVGVARAFAARHALPALETYLSQQLPSTPIKKADQDRLDAILCAIIAITWRLYPPEQSVMLCDEVNGYIVAPISDEVRRYLKSKDDEKSLAVPFH